MARAAPLLALVGVASCSSSSSPDSLVGLLRAHFPEQADLVIPRGRAPGLRALPDGTFVPAPPAQPDPRRAADAALALRGGLRAAFPQRGDGWIRMTLPDGFAFAVREAGVASPGRLLRGALVYPRGEGASCWRATAAGFEEWLLVRAPSAGAVAAWEVRGATLRARGDAVDVVDPAGRARVTVTAPAVYAAPGARVAARLAGTDHRLALRVTGAAPGALLLVDPEWQATGGMSTPRYLHTATLLPTGQVLVIGGTAEVYDPTAGTFAPTAGGLAVPRSYHTATLLRSGQVLVAGGSGCYPLCASAELYDPVLGTFRGTGSMGAMRKEHAATLLASGQVLVTGGCQNQSCSSADVSAEVYDPTTGTFRPTAHRMVADRFRHTATLLPSGKVLVAGGQRYNGGAFAGVELYDPASDSFTVTASLAQNRCGHSATLLATGQVLVAGGELLGDTTAELYDPAVGTFSATGPLVTMRGWHTATLLPSGRVLVAGGILDSQNLPLAAAELYDPAGTFSLTTSPMVLGRWGHTATLLPTGKVLLVGGNIAQFTPVAAAELYDPSAQSPCADDAGCAAVPGYYCAAGGRCVARKPQGSACNAATDCQAAACTMCASGNCVDGFCCDTPCAGGCDACNGAVQGWSGAVNGTCAVAPQGDAGAPACSASFACNGVSATCPTSCASDAECLASTYCAPTGACVDRKNQGATCDPLSDCKSPPCRLCATTHCVDGRCCDTACDTGGCLACSQTAGAAVNGTCGVIGGGLVGHCSPYLCTGGSAACPTSCTSSGDCASGAFCDTSVTPHVCLGNKALGESCMSNGDCASHYCADGRCCDAACTGACRFCTSAGHCTLAGAGEDPRGDCVGAAPLCGGTCNGAGACAMPDSSTSCQPSACANGTLQPTAKCDGAGQCVTPAITDCGLYQCLDASRCRTSCGQDSDCVAGYYCSSLACVPALANGQPCASPHQCQTGNCVDGVCCDGPCDGACLYCNFPGAAGSCQAVPDGHDPRARCQASTGGAPACAGVCQSGQCAFPDVGTPCGLCSACDGTGRCTATPADDATCGVITCAGLDTACRSYQSLTAERCAALGVCKAANDPTACTQYVDVPCADGGVSETDGGAPQAADGGSGGTSSGGCRAAPSGPGPGLALIGLMALLVPWARRRWRRRR